MPATVLVLAGATAGDAARAPAQVDPSLPTVAGELIVGFAPATSQAERGQALEAVGVRGQRRLRGTSARLVRVDPPALAAALKRLRADPRVVFAEPNYRLTALDTPNDPAFGQLWGLVNTGQRVAGVTGTPDADIDADEAWDVTTGSRSVVVGVIDTGVDFAHPDLGGSRTAANPVMWTNPGETGGGRESNRVDDDGNGYVDDWRGWDWANDDNNPTDDHGHGTHVAGTIGALGDNRVGVTGVSWDVRIMALKFLDATGNGDLADAVEALRYATEMGAPITNNSWGGGGFSQAMVDALEEADERGALFVVAAGNSSADNDAAPAYPATYDVPNVLAVAASDQNDALAWFSNRGAATVGLAAPGTSVYSTVTGGRYDWLSGTSMAAPHVAGTAALGAAAFSEATGAGLKALLLRTVDARPSLAGVTVTGGRLNAGRALGCTDAPAVWLDSPRPGFRVAIGSEVPVTVLATRCAEPAGVTATASANGEQLALTPRGDGVFTGTYLASALGPVTLTATAAAGGRVDSRSASGTVTDGYRVVEEPFAWVDAAAGGTRLTLGDDSSAALPLPFAFRLYSETYSSLSVSSNGYLVLGSGAAVDYQNVPLPTAAAPNGLVAAYWDDLNPGAAGAVWYRTVGSAPNRRLVVSWVGVPHYRAPGPVSFQVVLEESTGAIVLAYLDTDHGDAGYDHGASATVGVESPDGSLATQFLYNEPRLASYQATRSLRFTRGLPAPPDTEPPSAPARLSATAGESTVALAWSANGETDLAGYHVYRRQVDGGWAHLATTTDVEHADAGLAAGTTYAYRVTAVDAAGNESAPSLEASATPTGDVTPPVAPTNLAATAGDGHVVLDWSDNADPVAQYRVYRDGVAVATVAASGYTDGGRTNGVAYAYRVTALDAAGNESGPSDEVLATPQPPPPPPPEVSYRIVEEPFLWVDATAGGTRLSLGDDAQAAVALPFAFRFYDATFASVNVSSNGFLAFGSGATSYENAPLPSSAAPNGLVAAYWDDLNPAVQGSVWYRTVGSAPNRRLVVSWVGVRHYSTAGAISFQAVLEEATGDVVLAYLDTDHGHGAFDHGASASVGVENLDGSRGTQFLHNQARLGPYQAVTALRFTAAAAPPPDAEPPAAPQGLTASGAELSVALAWAPNGESDLAGYNVYRRAADGTWARLAGTTANAYTDSGLAAGTPSTYRVTAVDATGNESAPSLEASATPTGDVTPPAAPTGLQASPEDARVVLDWQDNPDPVAGYRVYRDGAAVATVGTSAYTDAGRTNGVAYAYRVTAFDAAGNESGPSDEVTATPQAPPPPPPDADYRIVEEPLAWVDATAGGTRLSLGDDAAAAVALPFSFPFYGQVFPSVSVSSNGYLVFGSSGATAYDNTPLPAASAPNGVIAPYWDDLNPAVEGGVWYRTVGTAPNRRLVVSWVGVRHYSTAGGISFQAVLEEATGDVVLAYLDTDHGHAGFDHGASASVGVENLDGSRGTQFLHNQPWLAPYAGTTALRFTNR